jgi:hypothetical protein
MQLSTVKGKSRVVRLTFVAVGCLVAFPTASSATSATPGYLNTASLPRTLSGAHIGQVDCVSAVFCVAGGDDQRDSEALVSVYKDGNWVNKELGARGEVNSVSCVSATFCVAGGTRQLNSKGATQAFVSMYNGATWSDSEIAGTLNVGNEASTTSVSCVSTTFCVAGGTYEDHAKGGTQDFVSVYNGATWSDSEIAGTLNVGNEALLSSVSCGSTSFCVAGGSYETHVDGKYFPEAFVSVYNGATWSDSEIAGELNIGPLPGAEVTSVSCVGAAFCAVDGSYLDANENSQAFVSVYDGATWTDSEIGGALNVENDGLATSVSCASTTFCVAGGSYLDGRDVSQAFVSVYNGSTWVDSRIAGSLNGVGDGAGAGVTSVFCLSATFCVAGGNVTRTNSEEAFVSVYDGATWSDSEIANALSVNGGASVTSISCAPPTFCVASGFDSGYTQAFVSLYKGSTWTSRNLSVGNSAVLPKPGTVTIEYAGATSSLSAVGTNQLSSFIKKLKAGATLVVVGSAYRNAALAKVRAEVVEKYLLGHADVHISIQTMTDSRASTTDVTTVSQ